MSRDVFIHSSSCIGSCLAYPDKIGGLTLVDCCLQASKVGETLQSNEGKRFVKRSTRKGCLYSLDWTTVLDWTTGLTLELTFELFFCFQ